MPNINRRLFMQAALAASGSTLFSTSQVLANHPESKPQPTIGAFSKSFQDWHIEKVCQEFKKIGLHGIDLTVRKGGHIKPEDVATELPKAVQAAQANKLKILFLTTGITEPDQHAQKILATASKLGITRIKLGYFRYREFGTLQQQLDRTRQQIAKIAKLAKPYGVLPCVHIHSGSVLPSHGTQLFQIIESFSPDEVGAYVDPYHMAKEGGGDGWRQGLDLLAPWVALCSVKNCLWKPTHRDKKGQQLWKTVTIPLADGLCPLTEFVALLQKIGFNGPYSLHSEYKGGGSFQSLSTEECLAQTAEDLAYFRTLFDS